MLMGLCVQLGVLGVAVYVAGMFLFDITANMSYHGPVIALLAVNALIARFTDGTTIYVVPSPSKPKDKGGQKSGSGETSSPSTSKDKGAVPSGSDDTTKKD